MRSLFSAVCALLVGMTWTTVQAQTAPAGSPATPAAAAAPAAPAAPASEAGAGAGAAPAAEPTLPPPAQPTAPAEPVEPTPPTTTSEPPPSGFAPAFPVPEYQKPPKPTDWDQPTFPPPEAARRGRTTEGAFELNVPIWFTPDQGVIDPGFGFVGRFGLVVGKYFVPEVQMGWQINWLDDDVTGPYDLTMDMFWFSLGARVRFDTDGLVTPFVSGAFDMSFIHVEGDDEVVCGGYYYYYCDTVANYEFTPGFSGKVGVAFEITRYTAIDVGARLAMVFAGDMFPSAEGFVSPFVGVTFYN